MHRLPYVASGSDLDADLDWGKSRSALVSAILVQSSGRLGTLAPLDLAELISSLAHLGLDLNAEASGSGRYDVTGALMPDSRRLWASEFLSAVRSKSRSMGIRAAAMTMWGISVTRADVAANPMAAGERWRQGGGRGRESRSDWEQALAHRFKAHLAKGPEGGENRRPEWAKEEASGSGGGGKARSDLKAKEEASGSGGGGKARSDLSILRILTGRPIVRRGSTLRVLVEASEAEGRGYSQGFHSSVCDLPSDHSGSVVVVESGAVPSDLPCGHHPAQETLRPLLVYLGVLAEDGSRLEAASWWNCLATFLQLPASGRPSYRKYCSDDIVALMLLLSRLVPNAGTIPSTPTIPSSHSLLPSVLSVFSCIFKWLEQDLIARSSSFGRFNFHDRLRKVWTHHTSVFCHPWSFTLSTPFFIRSPWPQFVSSCQHQHPYPIGELLMPSSLSWHWVLQGGATLG